MVKNIRPFPFLKRYFQDSCSLVLFAGILSLSPWMASNPVFGQEDATLNRILIIDFESIIVNNPHIRKDLSPTWDMIAFVNNETVKLNNAGQLSSVSSCGEIPLGVE